MTLAATTLAAYDDVKRTLGRRQQEVLAVLEHAPTGLAAWEIATQLHRNVFFVMPRIRELVQSGVVIDSGTTRINPMTQKKATVWRRWDPLRMQQEFAWPSPTCI